MSWRTLGNCIICGKEVKFTLNVFSFAEIADHKFLCKDCYNKLGGFKLEQKLGDSRKWTEEQVRRMLDGEQPETLLEEIAQERAKEFRKKCNVCGHIFCYTQGDLEANRKKLINSGLSSLAAAGQMLGGAHTAGAVNSAAADNKAKEVIDYDRCPKCGSRDLRELTEEEFQQEMRAANAQQTASAAPSAADELKKFKELLDMGAISQEEYAAKKKQLLGL